MSDKNEVEIYRALRAAQEKYSYFLLAAAGAAIALAVNQTQNAGLSWTQIPLGGAIAAWGLSFFFGCRHLGYVSSTLYANAALIQVQSGRYPEVGRDPQLIAAASDGIRSAIEYNNDRASSLANWQFRCLVAGATLYVAWHVIEMQRRSMTSLFTNVLVSVTTG